MKRIALSLKRLLVSFAIILVAGSAFAQVDFNALEKDTINGTPVYRYPVQKSEGLYRIGVNFGVSQEEILQLNPVLRTSGLKLGQVILVPIKEQIDTTKFMVHIIQPKETLYSLGRLYDVRVSDIQKANPELSRNMPIGGKLLIPRVQEEEKEPTKSKRIRLRDLRRDEVAKGIALKDTLPTQPILTDTIIAQEERIKIAILLPFMTDEANRTAAIERFVEFYQGALLAIYNAQQTGQKFELFVYDTEKNDIRIQNVLQKLANDSVDAIIGPAYPSQVKYVSAFAQKHEIPTLVPFASKVPEVQKNPYLFQFNPSDENMAATLMEHVVTTYPNANFVCVKTTEKYPATSTIRWQFELKERGIAYQTVSDTVVSQGHLLNYLKDDEMNILMFDTEKFKQIKPLMSHLQYLQEEYPISVLSHYAWHDEDIPVQSIYPSVFKKKKLVDIPLTTYTLRFNYYFGNDLLNHAPRYDWLGYDLTTWLVRYLQTPAHAETPAETVLDSLSHEPVEAIIPEELPYSGLQSDISFEQVSEQGGYENVKIQIVVQ